MASFDVFVPCYNYGRYLRECVKSVLTQDAGSLRVLIIDDASTDNSREVAAALADADSRVQVISHEKNLGHIETYREGIEWASAEYCLLLSADDMLAPGALARAATVMENSPRVTLTYGAESVMLAGEESPLAAGLGTRDAGWSVQNGQDFIASVCRSGMSPVPTCTAVVRTSAQKRAGPYRAELPHAGDLEMWLRLAALGDVARTESVQGVRRLHGSNMSIAYFDALLPDLRQRHLAFETFFKNWNGPAPQGERLRRQVQQALAAQAYWFGVAHLRRGNIAAALQLSRFARELSPWTALVPPVGYLLERERPGFRLWRSGAARGHEAELLHTHKRSAEAATTGPSRLAR